MVGERLVRELLLNPHEPGEWSKVALWWRWRGMVIFKKSSIWRVGERGPGLRPSFLDMRLEKWGYHLLS